MTNTQFVMCPLLTGCHLGTNKGFMHYDSVYACHQKTCYNFHFADLYKFKSKRSWLLLIDQ